MIVGFIGQGFIGKNYAGDFERRGFEVVRYSLEPEYAGNKADIKNCDIVFIAVPTPTTLDGFDASIIRGVLPLVGTGKIAVIKSTTVPGTTLALQSEFPDIFLLHAPEFLAEKSAAYDAEHPQRNIIGVPQKTVKYEECARTVLAILPEAPYELTASSTETELIKYAGNTFLFLKVLYGNIFYDLAAALGADYDVVRAAISADPRIGPSHLRVVDSSGHEGAKAGRGAGGHCLIKDMAALRAQYEALLPDDSLGIRLLRSLEEKNKKLLSDSGKDIDLLRAVYGTI